MKMSEQSQQPMLTDQPVAKPRKPQKITQLLCLDQNHQLKQIFVQWLAESFKYLPRLLSSIYLELQLLINFVEYRFTVSCDRSQVGDYLQNIQYQKLTRTVKLLYLLMDVVLPYVKRRVTMAAEKYVEKEEREREREGNENNENNHEDSNQKQGYQHKILPLLRKFLSFIAFIDKLYALASFINLAIFIKNGNYRTITQRLLKMKMQFVNPQNSRVLNFTLMNRTMIWQIYQMVLKNILPYLYKFLGTGLKNIFYLHSYMGVQDKDENENCALCGEVPTMAIKAEQCGHVYCFYCSKSVGEEKKECKKCGMEIDKWKAVYG